MAPWGHKNSHTPQRVQSDVIMNRDADARSTVILGKP